MSTQETFISHLVELRTRLIRALLAVVVVFVCLFPWAKDLYHLLANPLLASLPQGGQMIATDVVGVFVVPMKVAFLVAFLIALPYVLYQLWAFIAPGLYAHEKRLVLPLVIGCGPSACHTRASAAMDSMDSADSPEASLSLRRRCSSRSSCSTARARAPGGISVSG